MPCNTSSCLRICLSESSIAPAAALHPTASEPAVQCFIAYRKHFCAGGIPRVLTSTKPEKEPHVYRIVHPLQGPRRCVAFALPSGVKPGVKYASNTAEEFEAYLRRSGLK